MKQAIVIGLALAAAVALPAFAVESGGGAKPIHHHRVYRHLHRAVEPVAVAPNAKARVPPPGPAPTPFPNVAPYPNNQGDEDGLSRDINDCNKGCIGGNPG